MLYRDAVTTGVDPTLLGIGPVPAVSQLLKRQKLNIEDISAIELNEAFSSQVLASINELHLGLDKVNQWVRLLLDIHIVLVARHWLLDY